jgi:signal transduction histidine kinase
VRQVVLMARRTSIAAILALGYGYYRISGGGAALAAIGLISFVGVAQFLPAILGGIFWRGATRNGAVFGLLTGFSVWAYTLFLPSFGGSFILSDSVLASGPWGIEWLRPRALFGAGDMDPLVHAFFWSMILNTVVFCFVSLASFPGPQERLQGAQFVNVFEHSQGAQGWITGEAEAEDLLVMSQRILGAAQAQRLFQSFAARQGKAGYLPDTSPDFLQRLERELAGSVGAATAHAMIGQIVGGASVSVRDLMAVADETSQMMEYSSQLETKSAELERTARQLREVNEKLTEISVQKDAFLSQISHELRTPMTSIRAFSEILRDEDGTEGVDRTKYASIIHDEAIRLTRLLDDLLDLSVLENGQVELKSRAVDLHDIIERSVVTALSIGTKDTLVINRKTAGERIMVVTDPDRLSQVFINLVANARKYCDAQVPELRIRVQKADRTVTVDFIDNGSGIQTRNQPIIFEKFSRLGDQRAAGSAGLGLAICREIMKNLDGSVTYLPGQGGAGFRVVFPAGQGAKTARKPD